MKKYTMGFPTQEEILDSITTTKNGCWLWKFSVCSKGYGTIHRCGRSYSAHRMALHLFRGFDLNSKLFVLHHCDRPSCINPDHLYEGTNQDNMNDMVKRKRSTFGTRSHTSKLKTSDIPKIFKFRQKGESMTKIARRFGVSYPTVYHILKRNSWKHIKINQGTLSRNKGANHVN